MFDRLPLKFWPVSNNSMFFPPLSSLCETLLSFPLFPSGSLFLTFPCYPLKFPLPTHTFPSFGYSLGSLFVTGPSSSCFSLQSPFVSHLTGFCLALVIQLIFPFTLFKLLFPILVTCSMGAFPKPTFLYTTVFPFFLPAHHFSY